MKYCEKCKVVVPSGRERCPLCQRFLTETDQQGYDDEIFPYIPTIYHQYNLLIRFLLFLSVTICVICITCNLLFWTHSWWSLFVLAGVGADGLPLHRQSANAVPSANMFCISWSPLHW